MQQLGNIKKKIEHTKDLSSIISTMKNIAIVNITHYERRVKAVRQYFATIEYGFQIFLQKNGDRILKNLEEKNKRVPRTIGVIVIGSEKGLCGEFNEKLLQFFYKNSTDRELKKVISIGHKIAGQLEGYTGKTYDFPSTHEQISDLLRELLLVFRRWLEKEHIGEIVFFHNQISSGLSYEPNAKFIFPLNLDWLKNLKEKPWPSHCLPTFSMDTEDLFYELTQEHLFISMYQSFIESLASENVGRLSSMQAAENNLEDRIFNLENHYHLQRQAQITEELYDIISGFEVLKHPQK